jgi:hypothetical protein
MILPNQQQAALAAFFTTKNEGFIMPEFDREEQKEIVKEAIHEWLEDKYSAFGKWTLHGILASALGAVVYYLAMHGGFK